MSNTTLNNDVNNIGFISATIMTVVFAITLVMDFWVQLIQSRIKLDDFQNEVVYYI
ncbi:MAG: hypothetical protein JSW11_15755 [Candidatus Heimdallarchaeota archaeon]|nr:MAG: hypothetical protein JSW11_15755 [Candidatus Heimdallarchaeota archaeon]